MTFDRYLAIVHTITRHMKACVILSQYDDSFFADRIVAKDYVLSYELEMKIPSIAFEPCQ